MRKAIQLIILALILLLIFVVPAQVIGDGLRITSGSVYSDRVEVIHNLEEGDYFLSVVHVDGKTRTTVAFESDGNTTRQTFDNTTEVPFGRAMIVKNGQILWRSRWVDGVDNDSDFAKQ